MASTSSEPYPKLEAGGGGEGSEAAVALMVSSDQSLVCRGLKKARKERACTAKERISKMPPCAAGKRSSIYRGVTRHRWTGRYEAHLWDKSTWNQNQNKKGKQVYLGAYDDEEAAARAYDLAALKYWGAGTHINFPVSDYTRDLEEMLNVSREEYLASLRRKSSVFSRGISRYRGLSSPWEPLFGRLGGTELFGNIHYETTGNEAAIEGEHFSGFCIERKFDLTSYIKWWGSSKFCRPDSISRLPEETKHNSGEDIGDEYKEIELATQHTEPYQMPRLGPALGGRGHKRSSVSALSILSRSAAFKNLQERVSIKKQYKEDEDHQKTNIMASFLSAPLLTDYNTTDPMADPTLWPALIPVLSPGISRINEETKTEE